MALIRVIATDGSAMLIHTSQLHPPVSSYFIKPKGSTWAEVWERVNKAPSLEAKEPT